MWQIRQYIREYHQSRVQLLRDAAERGDLASVQRLVAMQLDPRLTPPGPLGRLRVGRHYATIRSDGRGVVTAEGSEFRDAEEWMCALETADGADTTPGCRSSWDDLLSVYTNLVTHIQIHTHKHTHRHRYTRTTPHFTRYVSVNRPLSRPFAPPVSAHRATSSKRVEVRGC